MQHSLLRQARTDARRLVGIAEAHAEQRIDQLRQAKPLGDSGDLVAEAADIDDTKPQRFGSHGSVLGSQCRIDGAYDEILR
ncbi:hypothetical protein D3C71_1779640 [compost metagenome]